MGDVAVEVVLSRRTARSGDTQERTEGCLGMDLL
jgi:hypothetical protein